jgi:sec-independent protein translocase protein TatB
MVIAPTVQIASLGMADSLILMVMALVVFGPRRLPQIGRQIGKLMYEFRKASNDFKFQMEEELRNSEEADRRKKEEERLRALALAAPAPATAPTTVDSEIPIAVPPVGDPGPWGPSDTSAGETPNPAAGYDNGPVASTQIANTPVASTQEADTAPTIRPPSTGETVTATGPWSRQYEQAKAVEAAAATGSVPVKGATVDVPTSTANELPTSESSALESTASSPAKNESAARGNISSEAGSPEPVPEAAEPAASAVVNHHG